MLLVRVCVRNGSRSSSFESSTEEVRRSHPEVGGHEPRFLVDRGHGRLLIYELAFEASVWSRSGGSCCWCQISIRDAPGMCLQGGHERPCILVRQRRQASFAVRDQDQRSYPTAALDVSLMPWKTPRRRSRRGGGDEGRREHGQRPCRDPNPNPIDFSTPLNFVPREIRGPNANHHSTMTVRFRERCGCVPLRTTSGSST